MQSYTKHRIPGIRDGNGQVRPFPVLILALYAALASTYIPTALFTDTLSPSLSYLLSIAVPVFGIGAAIMITVTPKPVIPFCFIAAFIMLFGVNLTLSAILCVFLTLTVIYAYLIQQRLWYVGLIANVLSLAALFFVHGSIFVTVASLAFIPAAIALFVSFKQKKQRVASVASISFALALTFVAALLAFIYVKDGNLYAATIKNFFDTLKSEVTAAVGTALTNTFNNVQSDFLTLADVKTLSSSLITLTFNLLPATLIIVFFVISFVAHSLYVSLLSVTLEDKKEITNAVTFRMSVTSALVFIASYIVALALLSDGMSIGGIAAQNIYTILAPGLSLVTFGFFGALVRSGKGSCLGTLIYFAMFALLFVLTDVILVIASFAGAIIVIVSAIKSKGNKQ